MPRKPPVPPVEHRERAASTSISLAPEIAGVLGELDFESDEVKTGVIASVIDTGEVYPALKLLSVAIRKSEELAMTCYVVRSGTRLYATNVPPMATKDIDAMYLIEVKPPIGRDEITRRLFTAFQAMLGRIKSGAST